MMFRHSIYHNISKSAMLAWEILAWIYVIFEVNYQAYIARHSQILKNDIK